jgi:hypothetical protein
VAFHPARGATTHLQAGVNRHLILQIVITWKSEAIALSSSIICDEQHYSVGLGQSHDERPFFITKTSNLPPFFFEARGHFPVSRRIDSTKRNE